MNFKDQALSITSGWVLGSCRGGAGKPISLVDLHACSVTQSCLTLCDPMDYNMPGPSVKGISQGAYIPKGLQRKGSRGCGCHRDWSRAGQKGVQEQGGPSWEAVAACACEGEAVKVRMTDRAFRKHLCRVRTWGHREELDSIAIDP